MISPLSKTPSRCGEHSRQPRASSSAELTSDEVCLWAVGPAWSPKLKQPSDETSRKSTRNNKLATTSDDVQNGAFRRRAKKPLQTGSSWRRPEQINA